MEGVDWLSAMELAPSLGLQIALGLCLAATTGLRTFLPLLAVNLVAMSGAMELNESYGFIGHWGATVVFGTATLIEILGDKVIGLDHTLDAVGLVAKPVAATILAAAVLVELDPMLAAVLGIVGGGAPASALGLVKAQVRAVASVTTAGVGNTVLSFVEDAVAILSIIVALLVPGLALLLIVVGVVGVVRYLRRARRAGVTAP
ncbi:MAG: DUF4126 domain-containing protein [Myxococcota bacterium]